jgi:hypothetical protein
LRVVVVLARCCRDAPLRLELSLAMVGVVFGVEEVMPVVKDEQGVVFCGISTAT